MKNNTSLGYIDIWSFIHLLAGYLFTKLLLRTTLPKTLVIIISVIVHQVFEIFESTRVSVKGYKKTQELIYNITPVPIMNFFEVLGLFGKEQKYHGDSCINTVTDTLFYTVGVFIAVRVH
tara:strand:- start:1234 stop:1593 length:360 start_codon:yes stop_codon:yes gene_type:complete